MKNPERHSFTAAILTAVFLCAPGNGNALGTESGRPPEVVDVGSRLELFVDEYLIERLDGVELRLQRPRRMPRARSPLMGSFMTVVKDGDLYRAWYRGDDPSYQGRRGFNGHPGELTAYAESRDGHEWVYPDLGIHDIQGTLHIPDLPDAPHTPEEEWLPNNAVLAGQSPFSHNLSPFLDTRPGVPENERYKAIAGVPGPNREEKAGGLHTFISADGVHWEKVSEEPVIPYNPEWANAFDSQNVVFWSEAEGVYVCYLRLWMPREDAQAPYEGYVQRIDQGSRNLRAIGRSTSPDFIHWSEPVLTYPNLPGEHLYTNQTHPYFRAPHIYVALPSRYTAGRVGEESTIPMLGSMDILFMTWRTGLDRYTRLFHEAFIRPGLDPERWGNRANYVALNVLPTGPAEMSIWHNRSGYRYVLRTDGFVAAQAGAREGELLTRPLTFEGDALVLNYSTSAAGGVRVELQHANGEPLAGFRLEDSLEIIGDEIERTVRWKGDPNLGALAGRPVRLRFVMREADLFSFRFR